MPDFRRFPPSPTRSNIAVVTALTLTLGLSAIIFAHDEHDAPHQGNPPLHVIDRMHAFQHDDHEPENLAAQSITSCAGGFAGAYPCSNVDLMSFLPLNQIGGGSGTDIWGWTDPQTGKEYAIMGRTNGTSFVDISDPVNPVYLGDLALHGTTINSIWRDIKVYADHAFAVSEANNSGMQVFDLTQLRNVASPPVTFSETAWYGTFLSAHNLVINEDSGYAYAVGTSGGTHCSGGLHMIDISTPTAPVFAGCFSSDGYTHDAQCVNYQGPDTDHQGKEICFNSNEDTLTIVDVTNKGAPAQLSRTSYGGSGYTHQGWLTEDHVHFLLDDEGDESSLGHNTRTFIWNVSNLDNPSLVGNYTASTPAIDHNQYVKGNHTYQSNYRAGLWILDLSNLNCGVPDCNLSEAGYFDVYPANDAASFNGTWSNFPYFDSGLVAVSGREQGLFIVKPNFGGGSDPPTVTMVNPLEDDTVSGNVTVQIDASDDEDPVGSLDVDWNIDGGPWQPATHNIGTGYYEAAWDTTLSPNGLAVVNARAIDSDPQETTNSVNVDVFNTVPTFHIESIDVTVVPANGRRNRGRATVFVVDGGSSGLNGVTVEATFTGDSSGTRSGVTNGAGQVVLDTPPIKDGANWTFCVDNATKTGWIFDAAGGPSCGSTGGATFGTISGRLTDNDDSSPISGANVSADTGESTSTDGAGDYTLTPVPTGTRTVTVTAAGYNSKQDSTSVSDGGTSTLDFALDPAPTGGTGTIKCTVTDNNGSKLGGVLVWTDTGQSALTNRGGKCTVQNVPEGSRTVTASIAGFQDDVVIATVNAGSTTPVNFSLSPS